VPTLQSTRYALRAAVAKYFEQPAADVLARAGFTPARATLAGLALTGFAGYAAAGGFFWQAGVFNALGSLLDLLDGAIARRQDKVTKAGALLDSTADRAAEAAVLIGLAWWYSGVDGYSRTAVLLASVALAGSMLVSYVRARAEGLGYKGTSGFLTRPERVVITTACLLLSPLWGPAVVAALWILAVGTPLSALQRFWTEWRAANRS
jgi:CDP-diacylglycerol--glycerol-3-phosphate 3-phosphatidyltransferase